MPDSACYRYVFHGRVQGVGFRWTTRKLAKPYALAGYVRNVSDGTVEMVIVGTAADRDALVAELHAAFPGHIDEVECAEFTAEESFTEFGIRR